VDWRISATLRCLNGPGLTLVLKDRVITDQVTL
jgi:hypothetical protein